MKGKLKTQLKKIYSFLCCNEKMYTKFQRNSLNLLAGTKSDEAKALVLIRTSTKTRKIKLKIIIGKKKKTLSLEDLRTAMIINH